VLGFSQEENPELYKVFVRKGDSLYGAKAYKKSADAYAKGFSYLNRKAFPNDRYNAACSYALSNQKDSSFYHLYRLAHKSNYSNLDHLLQDLDLKSLHREARWDELISLVKENKEEKEKNYNLPLYHRLDSIYELDQGIRQQHGEMTSKYEHGSKELTAYWDKMRRIDRENEKAVTKILDEHGWLGSDVVGEKGNTTLFLVIQHAPIDVQQKYLPMMRQAVKDGKARGSSLALLEDRVLLRTGNKQIFGSQIGRDPETFQSYVMALEDPLNVDERRASVGLPPIAEYLTSFGVVWNPQKYLEKMAKYEMLLHESMKIK